MLKGFLKVKAQASKQAVLSAINLLGMTIENPRKIFEFLIVNFKRWNLLLLHWSAGQAVIKAAKNGTVFPLKKRDIMLNYIISLMEKDEKNSLDIELQHTQVLIQGTSLKVYDLFAFLSLSGVLHQEQ